MAHFFIADVTSQADPMDEVRSLNSTDLSDEVEEIEYESDQLVPDETPLYQNQMTTLGFKKLTDSTSLVTGVTVVHLIRMFKCYSV